MFVGHPQAGKRAAIIYSVLISCQRLEIDPSTYLSEILSVDTRTLSEERLAALTPAEWKKSSLAQGADFVPLTDLRRISYVDTETGKTMIFLTNNFEIDALVVAKIYKARWQIALFFKWIKQNLRIKAFST